jgi:hypothetical protein
MVGFKNTMPVYTQVGNVDEALEPPDGLLLRRFSPLTPPRKRHPVELVTVSLG